MKQLKVRLHGVETTHRFDDAEDWSRPHVVNLIATLLLDPYATRPYVLEYRGASSWYIYRGQIGVGYAIATPELKG